MTPDELFYFNDILQKGIYLKENEKKLYPIEFHQYIGGWNIYQHPLQFAKFCSFMSEIFIKSYVEIGIKMAGTFRYISQVLRSRNNQNLKCFGIDINIPFSIREIFANTNSKLIELDSRKAGGCVPENIGLVFIDGSHTYESVKSDWDIYGKRSEWAAFHDIVNPMTPGVVQFWNEIKQDYLFTEFIEQFPEHEPTMGIGLLKIA